MTDDGYRHRIQALASLVDVDELAAMRREATADAHIHDGEAWRKYRCEVLAAVAALVREASEYAPP